MTGSKFHLWLYRLEFRILPRSNQKMLGLYNILYLLHNRVKCQNVFELFFFAVSSVFIATM